MKVAVAYDSVYGNTRSVAEAIAGEVRDEGHAVEMWPLREGSGVPTGSELLFLGGPTHLGRMTRPVARFVRGLGPGTGDLRAVVVFDTYGPLGRTDEERRRAERWIRPGAAGDIEEACRARSLFVYPRPLRLEVETLEGPLSAGALDCARAFARFVLLEWSAGVPASTAVGTGPLQSII